MSEVKQAGEEETQQAIDAVLSQIDLTKITQHEVYHDVMRTLQEMSFKFVLAAKLMEHIFVRDGVFQPQPQEQEDEQRKD